MPASTSQRVAIVCALATLACSGGSVMELNHASVRTESTNYSVGATVAITVTNLGARSFTLGEPLCPVVLERQVGSDWVPAEQQQDAGSVCGGVARDLAAGEAYSTTQQLPAALEAGTYRFRLDGLSVVPTADRTSNPFRVE